jgi:nucleoside-diphosphate-sugar epimerase
MPTARRRRLLLTGATGFVGRALLDPLCARGFEVHAVARTPGSALRDGVTWHEADLLEEDAARALVRDVRPEVLVHAAWYVAHGRFWTAPENEAWVEASTALGAAFGEAGGRRLIGLGTCAEYADTAGEGDGRPWPEDRAIDPATPYGRAKARLAARWLAMPGLSVAWARIFHLFGPREAPARLVPSVARALLAGEEAACASGQPVRDFCSTAYLGRALAALAASDATGPVNTASGEAIAIRDLVALIGELTGRGGLIRLGRLPDRPNEVPFQVADTTRLRQDAGFAERADLRGDLARLLDQLRAAA